MSDKFPDISNMLPSAAKEAIIYYFYNRMLSEPLNHYGDTMYGLAIALGEARDFHTGEIFGGSSLFIFCYKEAILRWRNKK